jgi:hypothetical protein
VVDASPEQTATLTQLKSLTFQEQTIGSANFDVAVAVDGLFPKVYTTDISGVATPPTLVPNQVDNAMPSEVYLTSNLNDKSGMYVGALDDGSGGGTQMEAVTNTTSTIEISYQSFDGEVVNSESVTISGGGLAPDAPYDFSKYGAGKYSVT